MRKVESGPVSQPRLVEAELMTVVVGIDFSPHGEDALWFAQNLARGNPSATLHLVHVVAPPVGIVGVLGAPIDSTGPIAGFLDRARLELERICANVPAWIEGRVVGHVRTGDAPREITVLARELDADLIVVGTHARTGLGRVLMGSLAENIMRHAPCSVLIAHGAAARATPSTHDVSTGDVTAPDPTATATAPLSHRSP
ncbi:universal stress protein [Pendulispora albinea]|uniref:Universal stress protein n=1 Tax=Pendulispora albinea TaxID=2741071 RepID=A0ABZ2LKG7_9BACT